MNKLFVDDLRMPPDDSWDIARSVAQAIQYVSIYGCPQQISFDYCLANGKNIMPFIDWLIEQDKQKNFFPKDFKYDSHSSSSYGEYLILTTLNQYFKNRLTASADVKSDTE